MTIWSRNFQRTTRELLGFIILVFAFSIVQHETTEAKSFFLSLATGPTSGVYYPTGRAICDAVNEEKAGLYCSAEPTPGSVYNVQAIAIGEVEFAVVQSDVQYAGTTGDGHWEGHPVQNLRSVMSLYPEMMTIVSRADSGINGVDDLKGKRVNIGPRGSGTQATWDELERTLGMTRTDLALATEFPSDSTTELLCNNQLDASIAIVGHPSKMVAKQLAACHLTLVSATGPSVDKLLAARPYFVRAVIPASTYGLTNDIATFGSKATLVTSVDVPDEIVYKVTKAILTKSGTLRDRQPTLAGMKANDTVRQSLTAPLHPGALKAYKERGLVKQFASTGH
jgi:uncharacterized protein